MGVYIKGMEMPESCVICRLECLYRIHNSVSRSECCPLVEVKTPHGRLKDVDDLIDWWTQWDEYQTPMGAVIANLDDAPTAIEAEGGE